MGVRSILGLMASGGAALALIGAGAPSVLSQITPGLWEVTRSTGGPPTRICISKAAILSQLEHRSAKCGHTVLRNDASLAVVEYNCPGQGFGHSRITVRTPRSVKIDTQGIAQYAPFSYSVEARRVRDCPGH